MSIYRIALHEMMDLYYPGSTWLRLGRDAFERLDRYRRTHGLGSWEEALYRLLPGVEEAAS